MRNVSYGVDSPGYPPITCSLRFRRTLNLSQGDLSYPPKDPPTDCVSQFVDVDIKPLVSYLHRSKTLPMFLRSYTIWESPLIKAAQQQAIEARIYHTRQELRCWVCKEAPETIQHVTAGSKIFELETPRSKWGKLQRWWRMNDLKSRGTSRNRMTDRC